MTTYDDMASNETKLIGDYEYEYEVNNAVGSIYEYDINEDEGIVTYVLTQGYAVGEKENASAVEYENNAGANDEVVSNDDELYNCNVCGTNFKSIDDHVAQYHSDQDIIIDVAEYDKMHIKAKTSAYLDDADVLSDFQSESDIEESTMDGTTDTTMPSTNNNTVIRSNSLAADKITDTITTLDSYICKRCNKIFDTLRALSVHLLNAHLKQVSSVSNQHLRANKFVHKFKEQKIETVKESFLPIDQNSKMKILEQADDQELNTIPMNNNFFNEIHVQMHNGDDKVNCAISNETNSKTHMNAHQKTQTIKTQVQLNSINLPYLQMCQRDILKMHEAEPLIVKECDDCSKSFKSIKLLNRHIKRIHSENSVSHKCPYCEKSLKYMSSLTKHLQLIHQISSKQHRLLIHQQPK